MSLEVQRSIMIERLYNGKTFSFLLSMPKKFGTNTQTLLKSEMTKAYALNDMNYAKRHVTVTFSLTDKNRCTSTFLIAKYSKAKIHFMKY